MTWRERVFLADEAVDYGDIVIGGRLYNIGTPIYKWADPEGFSGYQTKAALVEELDRKTGRIKHRTISGRRYSKRKRGLESISQIMIHHTGGDGNGAGRVFDTLHNQRGLSVHFVIDDDGRVWQFLDCEEKAWHGGKHNDISVGIECNLYPLTDKRPDYYSPERCAKFGNLPHEIREEEIHGRKLRVFCFTDPQVEALARVCAGVWFAVRHHVVTTKERRETKIGSMLLKPPSFPRDSFGIPRTEIMQPKKHIGLIGHLQATSRKIDPAGFPWERFEERVAALYHEFELHADPPF